jgi:hypothetical protein
VNRKTDSRGSATGQDNYSLDQFEWLRQVAFDRELSPIASRVAIALTKYFNRKHDGWAWMSQDTLAQDLGKSLRTVGAALADLVERGHLIVKRRGMTETNLCQLVLKDGSDQQNTSDQEMQEVADHDRQEISGQERVTGSFAQSDRQNPAGVTGKNLPTNPLNEPIEEPIEEIDSPRLDLGEEVGRRSQSPFPDIIVDFEAFWVQYPKKVDKGAARVAYRKVRSKGLAAREQLLNAAMAYAAERSRQDQKFTKNAATWLNAESWANEPAAPANTTAPSSGFGHHLEQALADAQRIAEGGQ